MENPQDPGLFNHRSSHLSTGRKYHYVDEKPANYDSVHTPVLLLVHGFPDFWCVLNGLMGRKIRLNIAVVGMVGVTR